MWTIPLLLAAAPAPLTIRYVGPIGVYCRYSTIQTPVDAILVSPGAYAEFEN